MKTKTMLATIAVAAALACHTGAQIYDTNNVVVQTFAGSGFSGYVDGKGVQTMFNNPSQVVADSSGNLFVLDRANYRVRKITPDGVVKTFAGGGTNGLPGYGTNVTLRQNVGVGPPYHGFGSMTIDHSNVLWITIGYSLDSTLFLRIGSDAHVSKITWDALTLTLGQVSVEGSCVDSANNVYFSVRTPGNGRPGNQIYRSRTDGNVEIFAGSGNQGSADGNGMFSSFNEPTALAADAADNIYVWDLGNRLIRRINQSLDVVTVAGGGESNVDGVGTNASFNGVPGTENRTSGMTVDKNGNIYLACGSSMRKMDTATNVVTMAGSFSETGYVNGVGNLARFRGASAVCWSQGSLFVLESENPRIRQISFDPQPQLVADSNLGIQNYAGITITGLVGRTYQIQSSPDTTNWTARATLLLTASPYLWFDLNPISGSKFYRAFLLP